MPQDNPIYNFLVENKLTTKDRATFEKEYSDPKKAQELYGFLQSNNLTTKEYDDFYSTYFSPKKKETSPSIGDVSKTSSQANTVSQSQEEIDPSKDPVKATLHPFRQHLQQAQTAFDPLRNRAVSDQTRANVLPFDIKNKQFEESDFGQKQKEEKGANIHLQQAQSQIHNQLRNVSTAKRVLEDVKQKHGGVIPADNETAPIAKATLDNFEAANKDNALVKAVADSKDVKDFVQKHSGALLPDEGAQAAKTWEMINDPNVEEAFRRNPDKWKSFLQAKSDFNNLYPKAAKQRITSQVADWMGDTSKGGGLYNSGYSKKDLDEVVEKKFKQGEINANDRAFYYQNVKPDDVPTTGAANIYARNYEQATRNSFLGRALSGVGLMQDPKEKYKYAPHVEPKGIIGKGAELAGQLTPLMLTNAALKGAGFSDKAANVVSAVNQFGPTNEDRGDELFHDSPAKKWAYTIIGTGIDALATELPIFKSGAFKSEAESLANILGDKAIEQSVKEQAKNNFLNRIESFVGDAAKNTAQGAGVLTAMGGLHQFLDVSAKAPHAVENLEHTNFVDEFLNNAQAYGVLGLAHSVGKLMPEAKQPIEQQPQPTPPERIFPEQPFEDKVINAIKQEGKMPDFMHKNLEENPQAVIDELKDQVKQGMMGGAENHTGAIETMYGKRAVDLVKQQIENERPTTEAANNTRTEEATPIINEGAVGDNNIGEQVGNSGSGEGVGDKTVEERKEQYDLWKNAKPVGGDEMIKVYRTVKEGSAQTGIKSGDWVSANMDYIRSYGDNGDRILEAEIPAKFLKDAQTGEMPMDTLIYTPEKFEAESPTTKQPTVEKNKPTNEIPIPTKEESTPIEEPKVVQGLFEKASKVEDLTNPRERVLEHFANGGKIHTSSVKEVFGDKEGERKARIGLMRKDAQTIEQLAHSLWESDPTGKFSTSDYKDAIEQVLIGHKSNVSAAKELIGVREAAKHELSEEEIKNIDDKQLELLHKIVKEIPDDQKQDLVKLLEQYQNKYGLVDWERLEKDTNGFDPKFLNLPEQVQTSLYDLIEKNISESGSESTNATSESVLKTKDQEADKPPIPDTGQNGNEPPTGAKETVGAYSQRPATELSHRGLQVVANEFSFEDVKSRDPKTDVKLRKDAETTANDWKEKGEYPSKIEELTKKAEDKGILTDEERMIMQQHLADVIGSARKLDKKSAEYDAKLQEIKRLKEAGEKTRSAAGAALRIPVDSGSFPRTLEDAMVDRMNAAGVEKLTDEQKKDVEEKYSKLEENQKLAEQRIADLERKNMELQAELELQKQKKSTAKKQKDFKSERQDIRNSIKEKWNKAANDNTLTAVPLPYAKQLSAIAPDVAKLMKSYIEEGIVTFSEVIDKLHDDVRGVIPEIKREDVVDILAGKHDEPKPTKSDLMEQLKKIANKNSTEALKIKAKLASGDFSKPNKPKGIFDNPELKTKYPELYKKTLDAIRAKEQAKHELAVANLKEEMGKRNFRQKAIAEGAKVLRTAKALKAGIDFSATLVQNLLAILAHPVTGVKGLGESFKDFASANRFERELARLHNSEWWPLIEKSKLSVVDPKSLRESEKNDIFNDTYFDNMKLKTKSGKEVSLAPTKPFERQFTSLGNYIRLNLFLRKAEELMESGKTFESHPEEYKSVASVINNMTGRGTMTKSLENHNDLLSSVLWSPRLLASTMNVLGLGEFAGKGFYRNLTPAQRKYAAKEVAKGIGMGIATMAAIAYATGGKPDLNPTSVTFGTVDNGDYKWTVFGRFTSVVRMLAMLLSREKTTERGTQELDNGRYGATTGNEAWKFIRGKMNPSLAFGVDIATNQMYSGEKPTVRKELANMLAPMSVSDITTAVKQDGMKGLLVRGIPSVFGAKVSNENDFIQQNTFGQKAIINGENREMTDDEFQKFAKKKNEILQSEIEEFRKKGAYVVEDNKPVYKSYSQMTMKQRQDKEQAISLKATAKAKETIFGKQKESKAKDKADAQVKKLNDKLYK